MPSLRYRIEIEFDNQDLRMTIEDFLTDIEERLNGLEYEVKELEGYNSDRRGVC